VPPPRSAGAPADDADDDVFAGGAADAAARVAARAAAPAGPALVVNLGSELERWSDGAFRATLHCVVNERGAERHALPFFYEVTVFVPRVGVASLSCSCVAGWPRRSDVSSNGENTHHGTASPSG